MKKPKIVIEVWQAYATGAWFADVGWAGKEMAGSEGHETKKAAREWAKEWCREVGAALVEKGNDTAGVMRKLRRRPRCTCDQQMTDPNCPARRAGWRVGSDMECSVPPRSKGK